MNETELEIRERRLLEQEAELRMRETELEEKKRNRECNPGCGVLFPTTKKNSGRSSDWDGHAVTVCECGRNTKYQVACWDNGSVRDLRLRRWKP